MTKSVKALLTVLVLQFVILNFEVLCEEEVISSANYQSTVSIYDRASGALTIAFFKGAPSEKSRQEIKTNFKFSGPHPLDMAAHLTLSFKPGSTTASIENLGKNGMSFQTSILSGKSISYVKSGSEWVTAATKSISGDLKSGGRIKWQLESNETSLRGKVWKVNLNIDTIIE